MSLFRKRQPCPDGHIEPTVDDCKPTNCGVYQYAYAAGFRDALQKCREAVGEIKIEYYKFFISRPAVLAAISKVEEGMK